MPQASEWERLGQDLEVALYVRRLAEAEVPGSSTSIGTLVRQMADSLGLTVAGLRANRWRIVAAGPADAPVAKRASKSARDRLTVVPNYAGDDQRG